MMRISGATEEQIEHKLMAKKFESIINKSASSNVL